MLYALYKSTFYLFTYLITLLITINYIKLMPIAIN